MTSDVSLIICTRNRADRLAAAMPHVERLAFPENSELILVDNGSSDGTGEVIAAFARSAKCPVRVVAEPRPGISIARNAGLRAAAGRILAFTDDDCYPESDFLMQLLACYEERKVGFLGGRVLLYDKRDLPITIQPRTDAVDIAPRSFVRPGLIHGANMSFRREVFGAVGSFDELLGAGTPLFCAEDLDLFARASAAGFPGAYDPRPTVFHHHRRSTAEEGGRLLAGYDIGRGALYAKSVLNSETRRAYLWPFLHRIAGNIVRADFAVLKRELRGAGMYLRHS